MYDFDNDISKDSILYKDWCVLSEQYICTVNKIRECLDTLYDLEKNLRSV
jgi:hypothetical protein